MQGLASRRRSSLSVSYARAILLNIPLSSSLGFCPILSGCHLMLLLKYAFFISLCVAVALTSCRRAVDK